MPGHSKRLSCLRHIELMTPIIHVATDRGGKSARILKGLGGEQTNVFNSALDHHIILSCNEYGAQF
jgi:hypothetical protein